MNYLKPTVKTLNLNAAEVLCTSELPFDPSKTVDNSNGGWAPGYEGWNAEDWTGEVEGEE